MRCSRGQALVELAVCLPVVLLLSLGVAALVQVADAETGLNAATQAAIVAAARAPDATTAHAVAQQRFDAVIEAYPIRSAEISLDARGFVRGAALTATATGYVDLAWEAMAAVPARVDLVARATAEVEPWRTR